MNKKTLTRLAATAALVTGVAVATAIPAQADGGGGQDQGKCSMGSTFEVKGSPDHGKIEIEIRIDTGHQGQVWNWQVLDNGSVAAQGQNKTSHESDGRLEVQRRIDNLVGPDSIDFMASNAASGETCTGHFVVHGQDHR